MLESVLRAAASGVFVFPCDPGGKEPIMTRRGRLKWGDEATRDPDKIRFWWTRAPDANVGVACKPSGLLVIDCDMPKPGKVLPGKYQLPGIVVGVDVFAQITEDLGVPFPFETFTVSTPSGGQHYYFRNSGDRQLTSRPLVSGWIDVRANGGKGGYVVGPGSSDHRGSYEVMVRSPIAEAPEWLLRLCSPPPEQPRPAQYSGPFQQPHQQGGVNGVVNTVRYAKEGNRNWALLWGAQALAEEAHTENEIFDLLYPAAIEAGCTPQETKATIRSGITRGRGGR